MTTFLKVFGTIIGVILIFSGGVDFGLTTVPGIALVLGIWGIKWK